MQDEALKREWFELGFLIGRYSGLARLLEVCRYRPYTRELLTELKAWRNGQLLLKLAVKHGLVERVKGEGRRVYNQLTARGEEVLRFLKELEF